MVATRLKNEEAHPGLPDLPSPKQRAGQSKVTKGTQQKQKNLAITEVAALETELLAAQEHAKANACQPAGPGISKKQHSQTTATVGTSANLANLGTATVSPRQVVRDNDQIMADAMAMQQNLGERTGNQIGAVVVTMQSNGCDQLMDRSGYQDEGTNEMERADGNSDLNISGQNGKKGKAKGKGVAGTVRDAVRLQKEALRKNSHQPTEHTTSASPTDSEESSDNDNDNGGR
ncbi:hypothetical protein SCLCIDRAFT_33467 [Scleroderma citrinum Foug A]|uniref:Uncharacterized protein n=1 Tax=Scleroderma citrinum Foug A TaxID=1036808 RepID=A0A0C3D5L6_9AGAM|nr:hypothetical protein SCLCIDRAFT_33467 [Scleroderma citrinum Foug A]